MKNNINQELCQKCKLCIEVCPVNMIGINTEGQVSFIPERENLCIGCGQCMAICTTDAITNKHSYYFNKFEKLRSNKVNYDNFMDFLASRRSVRNYKKQQISLEIINKITNSLRYAPFGAEPNKVKITIINNREKIEKALAPTEKFLDNIVKWVENPLISYIITKKKGLETFNTIKNHLYPISKSGNYKLEYGDRITRGAPAIMVFHAEKGAEEHTNNALIYATYAMLSIHSLGLGASMNGIIPASINKVKTVRNIFEIPEENEAVISIIFGYPKYKYRKSITKAEKTIYYIE